jgi:superfamily II DNA or RNA helicase
MADYDFNKLCNEVLTLIEIREVKLLGWGFVNIHIDLRREIFDILDELPSEASDLWVNAQKTGQTEWDIIQNLIDRRLLFEVPNGYRTRFAETVRLLFLLRQRFSNDDWQVAARLVSDLRLQIRRRRYPKRDIEPDHFMDALEPLNLSTLHKDVIFALLEDPQTSTIHLSRFQLDAIVQLFHNLRARSDCALAIGAGTGAGKTKAFYIPAFAYMADSIDKEKYILQAMAIYPRTELLKDQLSEAFSEARKLDSVLWAAGKRPITIGAYYGDTPKSADSFTKQYKPSGWKQTDNLSGWVCPFFTCPSSSCKHADMIWRQEDIESEAADNEYGRYGRFARLQCSNDCGYETTADQLLLTRRQMAKQPPDILFTTTEMLNRRLSRTYEHALFGIGTNKPPRLVLLDEIHTYEGLTGAQVAYLLRRWRKARGLHSSQNNLCFVGLSATLTQATEFFSNLTGISVGNIQYVEPNENDLAEEGIEYNIVLKGDPVSGTSLLSTSVQSAMLLGRALDNSDDPVSEGAHGSKTFAFTDKLDVINRWYHIQYDAEQVKTLSQWRQTDVDEKRARNELGQIWRMCELIGHDLDSPLRLARTTSQDRGFDNSAELIIATSTLEVGFNDPSVGAVIQHKAPRSMASFLQRKGRAGRLRGMRPWMAVITSAYGRDRWAFQHAEELFDPQLRPIHLPLENYYVRKIQASFVLMDWLAQTLKKQGHWVDVWKLLSSGKWSRYDSLRLPRNSVAWILKMLLTGERLDDFTEYMIEALGLQDNDTAVISILWGEPRSILFSVVPTLLRQLETDWQRMESGEHKKWADDAVDSPLPAFVPSALFMDLNVPEVQIRLPLGQMQEDEWREESLGLEQTLTEFAPARANKRYVLAHRDDLAYWLSLPEIDPDTPHKVSVDRLKIRFDPIPRQVTVNGATYMVYRPRQYTLDIVPDNVRSTSYGELKWRSYFEPQTQSLRGYKALSDSGTKATLFALPPSSPWYRIVQNIELYSQANGSWLEVTRLATRVHVDTRFNNGTSYRDILQFVNSGGQPAAIGFSTTVDAIKFNFAPLDVSALLRHSKWAELYQSFGPRYFLDVLRRDGRMEKLSRFELDWLWQIELSMLTAVAISRSCSLSEAAKEVQANRIKLTERTLEVIFQSQRVDDQGDAVMTGRLYDQLREHSANPDIQAALSDASAMLWEPDQDDLAIWLADCYASSLGATIFTAVTHLLPNIEPSDLLMDIDDGCIWISEVTTGGVGLVSKIAETISQHPRNFELQLLDSLEYCEREQLAYQLRTIAQLVEDNTPELREAFADARQKTDLPSLSATQGLLAQILDMNGIPPTRQLFVAMNNKFLRPNSREDSDELIATLARNWEAEEARLGSKIDLRVMSVAGYQIPAVRGQVDQVLNRIGGSESGQDMNQAFNLVQSLLWLNCVDSCSDCIEIWNPYQPQIQPSRALLMVLLEPNGPTVQYSEAYWESLVQKALVEAYQVEINCAHEELAACKRDLLNLLTTAIDIGFQAFYPVIERVRRSKLQWTFHLTIQDLLGD